MHKRVSLIAALVGVFFCATFALDVLSINEDASSKPQTFEAVKLQWESFKSKYGKKYPSIEEEQKRFGIFYQNLIDLEERKQSYGPSVQVGVTKFYDLTFEEYKQRHLHSFGPRVTPRPASRKVEVPVPTWDWSQKGAVTKVKNEEQCGATWAMAALDTLESVCKIAGYPLISLSTQQVLDCDNSLYDSGCNGGFPEGAYEYIIQAGGIESESSYPYKGQDDNCTVNPKDFVDCHMKSYKNVSIGNDEQKLVQFVYSQSPFVVCIDAAQTVFYDYTGGVITGKECSQTSTDHCVTVVGWVQMGGKSVWKLKNMWGTDWGVEGYVFFEMGTNTCGMDTPYTIAPCVKDVC